MQQSLAAAPYERRKKKARDRIIDAAYECFEQIGVRKTTLEEIARRADVSRPTVYKYFPSGKLGIIDHISAAESIKVNAEVKQKLVRQERFEDQLTEAILLVTRIAGGNPYIQRVTESYGLRAWPETVEGEMLAMHRKWWMRLLREAADRGDLARDIGVDEALTWISLAETTLLMWASDPEMPDAQLRRLIRRFFVDPLLAEPPRPPGPPLV